MVIRVAEADRPAFQLRPGEQGLSVFDPTAVSPALSESEILDAFRPGSRLVMRMADEIESKGLLIVPISGGSFLPKRLRDSHAEIRPNPSMPRSKFKQVLKELE